ncbi:IS21 family transposase [Acidobacteriota bacterium]
MAYLEHGMWEVIDVLRRLHRGEGHRSISRITGRSRNTVRRYAAAAADLGWKPGQREPDEVLACSVLARLRPGPQSTSPEQTELILLQHKECLRDWLSPDNSYKRGLKLTKVHQLLTRQGVQVSYSSLYRFSVKHFDFGRRQGTVRMADVDPGELAEVDFGRLGLVPDPEAGRNRVLYGLVVTLVFSRHQYVHLTHSQKLGNLIEGLEDAWSFFGDVTSRVVIDNLKAAVAKPDRYAPIFQRSFEEYAHHRGFIIDSTIPKHAQGKPHVERQIPYVRENFFRGESFLSREHAQQEAVRWCLTTAGLRNHGTTRKRPLVIFEKVEKSALKPLTTERFDPPRWAELKVHPDHHVRYQYALYSVPHPYRGRKVTLRADSKLVRIFVKGKLVKTHPQKPKGGRSTDYNDYPPEKTAYAMRDANYLIEKAGELGLNIGLFAEELLAGPFPWSRLRQAQKLIRMTAKYGPKRVDAACQRALHFGIINVHRVQRIVDRALENAGVPFQDQKTQVIHLPLRFLRDPKTFNHNHDFEENKDGNQDKS